ncbi:DUF2164 domain-containing protein [Bacillus suaedaesalsae]|uniref:DUF2164 domain-containing protein n=1 Tax=Bacillus suaedaesalsae TaxID=2810349 RepID=A0ABS2DLT7_9BACI|nr:DUF2164 domain-containing protein [Bacillus suaedaesalsae]MBM6619433.1 DUF2164 domain-containing protein [Bacillus suaedaesalsae]
MIKIPRNEKERLIEQVQQYFQLERGEEIGSIGAEGFLDFVLKEASPYVYNQAITDARKVLNERISLLEEELYLLEKPIQK